MTHLTSTIDAHRQALLRLVAMLIAGAGFVEGKPAVLSRMVRGTLLYSLRPAEAAARRLVFLRAYLLKQAGYVAKARAKRPMPSKPIPRGDGSRTRAFALSDPKKRFAESGKLKYAKHAPRLSFFDGNDPTFEAQPESSTASPDDLVDVTQLRNRALALKAGLEDLSKQARRLLRLQARTEKTVQPIRRGTPPGYRARARWEVDEILRNSQFENFLPLNQQLRWCLVPTRNPGTRMWRKRQSDSGQQMVPLSKMGSIIIFAGRDVQTSELNSKDCRILASE